MNRGSDDYAELEDAADRASMRPRFMNRGSPRCRRRPAGSRSRFNEAPIHESGK